MVASSSRAYPPRYPQSRSSWTKAFGRTSKWREIALVVE
jgi:hypothetical protein